MHVCKSAAILFWPQSVDQLEIWLYRTVIHMFNSPPVYLHLMHWVLNKMADTLQMKFSNSFLLYFDLDLTEICTKGSNWQLVSFGSGDGLVPIRDRPLHGSMLTNFSDAVWCYQATMT